MKKSALIMEMHKQKLNGDSMIKYISAASSMRISFELICAEQHTTMLSS